MYIITYLLVLLVFINNFCHGYIVTVDADSEECFFDKVEVGVKLGLTFEVSEGGFLDIDVRIVGPDGKHIHNGNRETSGKYTFAAHVRGMYTYCFGNKMSTMTPKVVMFNMDIAEPAKEIEGAKKEATEEDDLEATIKQLSNMLITVKHEQEYMSVRDRIHRTINESTNSKVVLWAAFEAIVLICVVIGQVWYLRRFFEVRRFV